MTDDPIGPRSGADQFHLIAPLYDLLMNGVPYDEWIDYLKRLLERRNARPRTVLDVACGTGNVSLLLAREGMAVTGVDLSPGMIEVAQQKAAAGGLACDFLVQNAADLDLPGRRFDLCVSLFDSLNYVLNSEDLQAAMERVAAHLNRNGLFIFDLNSEFALRNQFFDQNNLASPDRLRYDWESQYDSTTRLCQVRMKFFYREEDGTDRRFYEEHWQYAYRADEIRAMLELAGFDEIEIFQAYTLRAPTRNSDRIYYLARRP